jgi:hypothetical protein
MQLHEALQQIDTIRLQVARTEVFRGYRAATVGATGLLAFAAAALQPFLIPQPAEDIAGYLLFWIGVAAASVALVGLELAVWWRSTDSPFRRQQTLRAVEQFAPCLLAGATITAMLWTCAPASCFLLPGLWAIVFSLGVCASWRQLPAGALAVAAHYLAAGALCLAFARQDQAYSPWAMAGTFGIGQCLTSAVLYYSLERRYDR